MINQLISPMLYRQGDREPVYLYGNFLSSASRFPSPGRPLKVSLVILTSSFEATRGLFCDGPRNFNRGQMTRTTPELESPLSNLPHHTSERTFDPLRMT
ncbi:hypothetical protein AVEN_161074-1 [Araneus ventricosus]|uniref:Uncharacterized protein n=1 Tax=Araneus ventricosus TaxID=182803 RepID=A0A4Y2DYQ0_ARAVE|nr:hypothetical protein AVEN_161074-1 [Araneus ventricosus]